tara:strand:+ start:1759 stop:1911 length:153 start_codon:yes stop_codon:yes gene_type:complete
MRYKWALGLVINKVRNALSDTTAEPLSVDKAKTSRNTTLSKWERNPSFGR